MGNYKVINKGQNSDLIGGNFNNTASESIVSISRFEIDSNFAGRVVVDYTNRLTSFPKPITLESMGVDEENAIKLKKYISNVELNYDKSDLKSYVKFGSTREFFRVSIETIIEKFVGSLYVNSDYNKNTVIFDYSYNLTSNSALFKIPSEYIENRYGLSFDRGNTNVIEGEELDNINVSYNEYVIWSVDDPLNNEHEIIGFTGDSTNKLYVDVLVSGNPFSGITESGLTSSKDYNYHIKPKPIYFNTFLKDLEPFQEFMLTNRATDYSGFNITLKQPQLLDNSEIIYTDTTLKWFTTDGYNVDIQYGRYEAFVDQLLGIGEKYDVLKTDLVARFLVPASFIDNDYTDDKKNMKILRIYGKEFDTVKQFIDSLVNINKLSYSKKNNIPDQLVKNLAKTFGWEDFSLIKGDQLVETFFNTDSENNSGDLTPAELDIELWRRILLNTHYFWKTKGNKEAIKTMLMLIGVPEPFINITEYVYTVDGKINPNTVELDLVDLPSSTLPYNNDGYPIAPVETNNFYFQMSGNTDSGQAYMDIFRSVGFNLNRTIDNKKSWVEEDAIERTHYSTPNYYQEDSMLVLNTKEIDVSIDIARGIEYDVYKYIRDIDYVINSTGYTSPFTFVNLSLDYTSPASNFLLPDTPEGDVVVTFNGVTLLSGTTANNGDYYVNPANSKEIILHTETAQSRPNNNGDIIVITYVYKKLGELVEASVEYMVTKVTPNVGGTTIPLPAVPKGDVQLMIDGVSLTQGSSLFIGDYIKNPANEQELIVQNSDLSQYLLTNPLLQIAMLVGDAEATLEKKAEFHRVDSLNSDKIYIDNIINKVKYRLNYKADDVENVKMTVNGVTLEPKRDYTLNINNKYEIILPPAVKLGDIIGAFYLVDPNKANKPIVGDDFGLGDISEMSFLEFIELIQRRKINARDRKTVSDYDGGFYPSLLEIYTDYLQRSNLDDADPLKTNGYLFMDLYPYFDKYNSFFQNFVEQLLPSTIIQKKGGFLIRNTVFTKQKFMYKRGVSFDPQVEYLGDDGSAFMKKLPEFEFEWTNDNVKIESSPYPYPYGYLSDGNEVLGIENLL
jgi:hypothetical protein